MMQKLTYKKEGEEHLYEINSSKIFSPSIDFSIDEISQCFNFAFAMSFGKTGEHRDHRSGGDTKRKNGNIFIDTFQGKLAEIGACKELVKLGIPVLMPNFKVWPLGKWDDIDLEIGNLKATIKSTKSFGNLLFLEKKDWNKDGIYIPNLERGGSGAYEIFILVRLEPSGEKILKNTKMYYADKLDETKSTMLKNLITQKRWQCDLPGFASRDHVIFAINNGFILPKGSILNKHANNTGTTMDAENYYIQSGQLQDLNQIKKLLNPNNL